jgi:VIT1/CCC1 family predicted Fe2+/Mn2+ transporter
MKGPDTNNLIIGGVILLAAFWIFMSKEQAAPLLNTVTGGLLGYLGASVKANAEVKP